MTLDSLDQRSGQAWPGLLTRTTQIVYNRGGPRKPSAGCDRITLLRRAAPVFLIVMPEREGTMMGHHRDRRAPGLCFTLAATLAISALGAAPAAAQFIITEIIDPGPVTAREMALVSPAASPAVPVSPTAAAPAPTTPILGVYQRKMCVSPIFFVAHSRGTRLGQ